MKSEKGITLIELLIVVAMLSLAMLAVATYTLPWLAKEDLRSAVYDVQTFMQLARMEAVSRNRACRFVINTSSREISVVDTNGTTATDTDDVVLYSSSLPDNVSFARPDAGAAVTLNNPAGSVFETMFGDDGVVSLGTGKVSLLGGDSYKQVQVFGAGGIQVQTWNGAAWNAGG